MKLYSIETEYFKLDGGAMFGVVPKVIWNNKYPADENNLISMSMRLLLIVDGERKILIDSGIGDKHDEKFLKHYYLFGEHSLERSLNELGFTSDDITDNILTHLHFDHCGGSVKQDESGNLVPRFRNARYWVSKTQFDNGVNPNARERASYFNDNYVPLYEKGVLHFADESTEITENIRLKIFNGHTDGQIIPYIKTDKGTFVYTADLIPMSTHIHLPFIMSYDLRAIESLKEKELFLSEVVANDQILFFEHDFYNECCKVVKTEKGYKAGETFKLSDLFE